MVMFHCYLLALYMITALCLLYSSVCREQWIRAKYERKEFLHTENGIVDSEKPYITGNHGYCELCDVCM